MGNFLTNLASKAGEVVEGLLFSNLPAPFTPNLPKRAKESLKPYRFLSFIQAEEVKSAAELTGEQKKAIAEDLSPLYQELRKYVGELEKSLREDVSEERLRAWKKASVLLAEYEWILAFQLGALNMESLRESQLTVAERWLEQAPRNEAVTKTRGDLREYWEDLRRAEQSLARRASQDDYAILRRLESGSNAVADKAIEVGNAMTGVLVAGGAVGRALSWAPRGVGLALNLVARSLPTVSKAAAASYAAGFTLRQVSPVVRGEVDEVTRQANEYAWNVVKALIAERLPVLGAAAIAGKDLLEGALVLMAEGKAEWKEIDRQAQETANRIILDMQLYALSVVMGWAVRRPGPKTVPALPASGQTTPSSSGWGALATVSGSGSGTPPSSTSLALTAAGAHASNVPSLGAASSVDDDKPKARGPNAAYITFVHLGYSSSPRIRDLRVTSDLRQAELNLDPSLLLPEVRLDKPAYYLSNVRPVEGHDNLYEASLYRLQYGYGDRHALEGSILFTSDGPLDLTMKSSWPMTEPRFLDFGTFYNRIDENSPEGTKVFAAKYLWTQVNDKLNRTEDRGNPAPALAQTYIRKFIVGQPTSRPGLGDRWKGWFGKKADPFAHPAFQAVHKCLSQFQSEAAFERFRGLGGRNFHLETLNRLVANFALESAVQQDQGSRFQELLNEASQAIRQKTILDPSVPRQDLVATLAMILKLDPEQIEASGKSDAMLRADLEPFLAALPVYRLMNPGTSGMIRKGSALQVGDLNARSFQDYLAWAQRHSIWIKDPDVRNSYRRTHGSQFFHIRKYLTREILEKISVSLNPDMLQWLDIWIGNQVMLLSKEANFLNDFRIVGSSMFCLRNTGESYIHEALDKAVLEALQFSSARPDKKPNDARTIGYDSERFKDYLNQQHTLLEGECTLLEISYLTLKSEWQKRRRYPVERVLVAALIYSFYPHRLDDIQQFDFAHASKTLSRDMENASLWEQAIGRLNSLRVRLDSVAMREDMRDQDFMKLLEDKRLDLVWEGFKP